MRLGRSDCTVDSPCPPPRAPCIPSDRDRLLWHGLTWHPLCGGEQPSRGRPRSIRRQCRWPCSPRPGTALDPPPAPPSTASAPAAVLRWLRPCWPSRGCADRGRTVDCARCRCTAECAASLCNLSPQACRKFRADAPANMPRPTCAGADRRRRQLPKRDGAGRVRFAGGPLVWPAPDGGRRRRRQLQPGRRSAGRRYHR